MHYEAGLRARDRLLTEVGVFFNNTHRGAGICDVCTGPATGALCHQCRTSRETFGTRLADLVVPLTYIKGKMRPRHQSEHHMYAYKAARPAPKCRRDLLLMVFAATTLHARCIARSVGSDWDAVTFVPSVNRPGRDHPVAQLAAQGHSNKVIGARLYLSHRTVGYHLQRVFSKIGITSRSGLSSILSTASNSAL